MLTHFQNPRSYAFMVHGELTYLVPQLRECKA